MTVFELWMALKHGRVNRMQPVPSWAPSLPFWPQEVTTSFANLGHRTRCSLTPFQNLEALNSGDNSWHVQNLLPRDLICPSQQRATVTLQVGHWLLRSVSPDLSRFISPVLPSSIWLNLKIMAASCPDCLNVGCHLSSIVGILCTYMLIQGWEWGLHNTCSLSSFHFPQAKLPNPWIKKQSISTWIMTQLFSCSYETSPTGKALGNW